MFTILSGYVFPFTKVSTALSIPFAAFTNLTTEHRLTAPYQTEKKKTVVPKLRSVGCVVSVRFVLV